MGFVAGSIVVFRVQEDGRNSSTVAFRTERQPGIRRNVLPLVASDSRSVVTVMDCLNPLHVRR